MPGAGYGSIHLKQFLGGAAHARLPLVLVTDRAAYVPFYRARGTQVCGERTSTR